VFLEKVSRSRKQYLGSYWVSRGQMQPLVFTYTSMSMNKQANWTMMLRGGHKTCLFFSLSV